MTLGPETRKDIGNYWDDKDSFPRPYVNLASVLKNVILGNAQAVNHFPGASDPVKEALAVGIILGRSQSPEEFFTALENFESHFLDNYGDPEPDRKGLYSAPGCP